MYIPCVCAYLGLAEHDVEAAVGAVDDDFLGPDERRQQLDRVLEAGDQHRLAGERLVLRRLAAARQRHCHQALQRQHDLAEAAVFEQTLQRLQVLRQAELTLLGVERLVAQLYQPVSQLRRVVEKLGQLRVDQPVTSGTDDVIQRANDRMES